MQLNDYTWKLEEKINYNVLPSSPSFKACNKRVFKSMVFIFNLTLRKYKFA